MRLHQMIIHNYIDPKANHASSDGMEWVRIERITSLIASQGAAQTVDGLTPFGLIAHKAKHTSMFLREIIKPLIRAGAPLFGEDHALELFVTNPAFGPDDMTIVLRELLVSGQALRQTNAQGEHVMHLLARLHPQMLGEMENSDSLDTVRGDLGQLYRRTDQEGNLPLHRLVEAGGCLSAKPLFQYPGEQLCVALDWASRQAWFGSPTAAWHMANVAGETPLDLLADRIEEHADKPGYARALQAYLGDVVDMACAEIQRRTLDRATGPAGKGRGGVRL